MSAADDDSFLCFIILNFFLSLCVFVGCAGVGCIPSHRVLLLHD